MIGRASTRLAREAETRCKSLCVMEYSVDFEWQSFNIYFVAQIEEAETKLGFHVCTSSSGLWHEQT